MSGAIGDLAIGIGGIGVDGNGGSYLGPDAGLARLLDNIQVEVPAITLSIIQMMAWNAIEDFYIRSSWRRELVYWTMAPGVSEIDFNPFDETFLVSWMLNIVGLSQFKVRPLGALIDLQYPAVALRTGSVLLGLKPVSFAAITASGVASELWSTWFDIVRSGTLSRIYAMPAKPFSSPQLATYHAKVFTAGAARARGIADGQYNGSPGGRWSFPAFANGRRKN